MYAAYVARMKPASEHCHRPALLKPLVQHVTYTQTTFACTRSINTLRTCALGCSGVVGMKVHVDYAAGQLACRAFLLGSIPICGTVDGRRSFTGVVSHFVVYAAMLETTPCLTVCVPCSARNILCASTLLCPQHGRY